MTTPLFVTEDEVDPFFSEPFVDGDEERSEPVPHRYVSGGFKGTKARFSFYFPPQGQYQGRFFHNTYPMALSSDIGPFPIEFEVAMGDLGFTLDSGAYYVQTNNGGEFRNPAVDPAIPAYRTNAAAAKYSRVIARQVYGREHRPYGYLFGGSGGNDSLLADSGTDTAISAPSVMSPCRERKNQSNGTTSTLFKNVNRPSSEERLPGRLAIT